MAACSSCFADVERKLEIPAAGHDILDFRVKLKGANGEHQGVLNVCVPIELIEPFALTMVPRQLCFPRACEEEVRKVSFFDIPFEEFRL